MVALSAFMAVSAANVGVLDDPGQTELLLLGLVLTGLVATGMRLMMFCSAAWFTRSRHFFHGVAAFMGHSRYPIDIMEQPLRAVLTAIPLAYIVFYPVSFVLRPDEFLVPGLLAIPIALAMMTGGLVTLRFALRKYQSAGTSEIWGA